MWPAALTRLLRRRLIFIVIAILALVYILTTLFSKNSSFLSLEAHDYTVQRTRPLIWRTLQQHLLADEPNNRTNDPQLHCRNSVQGRELLADDRGFVCRREHMLPNGCCDVELVSDTLYYTCDTCNSTSHCCGFYEYCVSCCLHPNKRPLLELVLRTIKGRQATVYAAVDDHFELCLVKCRTNSHSVEHENKYREPASKYCYGPTEAHESQLEVSGSLAH